MSTDDAGHPRRRGDELIPDADMSFDRDREIAASPEAIWPWIVQVGKRRAGWYAPRTLERLLPPSRRATRSIEPRFGQLVVGDHIPDDGGAAAQLEVAEIDPPHALIYRDERRGAQFSWAITLTSLGAGNGTRVQLRFRGKLKSTGLRRRVIIAGGEWLDTVTGEVMLRGLDERVTAPTD